jgi:molybdopterin molybdotransferase
LAYTPQTIIWGLPAQVTSAQVIMQALCVPLLRHLSGEKQAFDLSLRPKQQALLSRNTASRPGREDYIRVRLTPRPDDLPLAEPVSGLSGLLRTLLASHGLVRIDEQREGLDEGSLVDVLLL